MSKGIFNTRVKGHCCWPYPRTTLKSSALAWQISYLHLAKFVDKVPRPNSFTTSQLSIVASVSTSSHQYEFLKTTLCMFYFKAKNFLQSLSKLYISNLTRYYYIMLDCKSFISLICGKNTLFVFILLNFCRNPNASYSY